MLLFLFSQSNVTDLLTYVTIVFTTKSLVQPNEVSAVQISSPVLHLQIYVWTVLHFSIIILLTHLTHCLTSAARSIPLEDLVQTTAQPHQITGNPSPYQSYLILTSWKGIICVLTNLNFHFAAQVEATLPLHPATPHHPQGKRTTRKMRALVEAAERVLLMAA